MSILQRLVSMVLLFTLGCGLPSVQNSAGSVSNEIPVPTNEINYRLPTNVLPFHYIIKLNANLDTFTFEGNSTIEIIVLAKDTKTITLHAKSLTFDEEHTTLMDMNNQTAKPVFHSINDVTDFLTVGFESAIAPGRYWLNFKYTGVIVGGTKGFIRKSYNRENGEKVWLALTHFQPTHARKAFPCFDEPAMKAIFEISIKHSINYTVISNMPAIKEVKNDDDARYSWTIFNVTPVMSTYLIAFVISDLQRVSSEDGKFRCWTQKSKIERCRFALDVGQKELKVLEDYMGSRHVIPKMDNVGIPSYGNGAMENWGLVTYKEDRLLNDEGVTTTAGKQRIALTISHEFTHHWFGNVVSPAWWNETWLSEGFATYLQYFITDKVNPSWRLMDQMVVENLQETAFVLNNDQYEHAINNQVNTPSEIAGVFDSVTYNTGGCVIRMTSHVLTDKVFQTALRQYIDKKKYGAATSDDLYNELVSAAKDIPENVSLREFLQLWMNQAGYPVIFVNRLSASPGHVLISQTRFTVFNTKNITNSNLLWIPVNYATESNLDFTDTRTSHWLPPSQLEQEIPLELSDDQWVIVNKQQTGFYRVNYDKKNWELIANYLNTPNYMNIHVLNRAQLLDDSFNLKENGYFEDYSVFLNISRYLVREDDYIAWYPAFRAFDVLNNLLKNTEMHQLFKLYILKLIENVENKVGYSEMPEDDHLTKLFRVKVINWACKMGSVKCSEATLNSLIEHLDGSKKISTDLREVIFCAGIRTANVTIWNKLFDLYLEEKNEEYSATILNALGCSSDPHIIKSFLAKAIDPNFKIESQHHLYKFQHLQAITQKNEVGFDIMLDFVIENAAALNKINKLWFNPYLLTILGRKVTPNQDEKVRFFTHILANPGLQHFSLKMKTFLNAISTDPEHYVHAVFKYEVSDPIVLTTEYESQIRSFLLSQNIADDSTINS